MQTNNGRFTVLPGFIVAEEIMGERQVTEFAFMADKTLYWRPMPKPYDFTHSDERNEEFSRLEVEALLSFKTGELDYFAEREGLYSFNTRTMETVLRNRVLEDGIVGEFISNPNWGKD